MGKRYYCDYCDRSFIDDVESRRKHLKSVNHERNRKLHYLNCRDLKTLIEEESKKEECRRFRNTGYCPYEEICNFTHYSKVELQMFAAEVAKKEKEKADSLNLPSIEDWLKKRQDNLGKWKNFKFELHHPLQTSGLLPPSLLPPTLEQMRNTQFETWG
ncbi:zinc finger matrin-type protein 5 [Halyomorpha halys]|uniref:zinc finger matrin-type protein 5 n=1 Tax=Halyomorpha halys TaxID=286706 RepID=UPI0006D4CB63|nr:zinc finger matrin-type protein 5 [Halyomorpha halys]